MKSVMVLFGLAELVNGAVAGNPRIISESIKSDLYTNYGAIHQILLAACKSTDKTLVRHSSHLEWRLNF